MIMAIIWAVGVIWTPLAVKFNWLDYGYYESKTVMGMFLVVVMAIFWPIFVLLEILSRIDL